MFCLFTAPEFMLMPCRFVLEQILSGDPTEVVVENIHEYLSKIGEDVRASRIGLEEFIVFKVRHLLIIGIL